MSIRQQKRDQDQSADATTWILAAIIVVLATVDLLVWASLSAPNPVSKTFANHVTKPAPIVRTAAP